MHKAHVSEHLGILLLLERRAEVVVGDGSVELTCEDFVLVQARVLYLAGTLRVLLLHPNDGSTLLRLGVVLKVQASCT